MPRASLPLLPLVALSLLACGDDGASMPTSIEETCASFCEKWASLECDVGLSQSTCAQRCEQDAAEYPQCEDELRLSARCFLHAEVTCGMVLTASVPRVVGDACDAQDRALDACRQAAMPGAGSDAGADSGAARP